MLWFWVCYAIVTCVGILHTIFNIYVLKMKPMDENGMGEAYEKTKPWHKAWLLRRVTVPLQVVYCSLTPSGVK